MLESSQRNASHPQSDLTQYTTLSLGELDLIVSQSEVVAIESRKNIDREDPLKSSLGWLLVENSRIPVYSLTQKLDIERTVPEDKSICAVLKNDEYSISLLCSDTFGFREKIIKVFPVPKCMRLTPSPIESIFLCNSEAGTGVSFVASSRSLLNYIVQYERH